MFHCGPCGHSHGVPVKEIPHRYSCNGWTFNGDWERPTLAPSLLVNSVGAGPEFKPTVCHLFIREGQIQYLSDCTHAMAGQTVPMEDAE